MKKTYYTYILQCKNNTKYYGHTNNLERRIKDHKKGRVSYTKNKNPELVYYQGFDTRSQAMKREKQLKNGRTRKETIEKIIKTFTQDKMSRV